MKEIETPALVIDLEALEKNLEILAHVQREADCMILLALKGFATWATFPLIRKYLAGVAASSPHEARLGREEFGGQVHTYAPAYDEASLREVIELSDHVIFNSVSQIELFRSVIDAAKERVKFGLRVHPGHSEAPVPLYDPCAPGSRLGAVHSTLEDADLSRISGLHFHALCEQGADALERTLAAFEEHFADWFPQLGWVNFGGGHHITKAGYDTELLIELVRDFKARHGLDVFLEPGEAIALGTGVLVATVLDIVENEVRTAILDTSATAHMPDVLEMPYRPEVRGAGAPGERAHTYRLGGLTCLAGDVVGDYSFDRPLQIGDRLIFDDMAHYTNVKSTTFNGVRLPSIALLDPRTGELDVVRRFGYEDYRDRLS